MLEIDEDSVICDLAETYHIYSLASLPLLTVATLVCGLRANSRIKQKLRNENYTTEEILLMNIADLLSIQCWQSSKEGTPKPKLLAETLIEKESENIIFDSADEFEIMRKSLLKG